MNILVWASHASILLCCANANPENKHTEIYGYRQYHKRYEKNVSKIQDEKRKYCEMVEEELREMKPDLSKFKDALTYSEQLARRPLDPNSCRRAYVNSKNYTRKSIMPEYLLCDSMFKNYGENVEKEALESLERRFVREKKEREEKERIKNGPQHTTGNKDQHVLHSLDKRIQLARKEMEEKEALLHTQEDRKRVKNVLESMDKRIELAKKKMEEKERLRTTTEEKHRKDITTVHPLYRKRTFKESTTEDSQQVFTASSGLLHELEKRRELFTGDSAHYDRIYEEEYKDVTIPPSQSLSSDYSEWEKQYEDIIKRANETTPHYAWWTYDPNETVENYVNGVPIHADRALYSLKMSSILPANISAEIDAHFNQKSEISHEYADRIKKSMEQWAKTLDNEYNSDAGPVPERRELRRPFEIFQNRFYDKEVEFQNKLADDVKNYFITPAIKGLYHFKKWINPKYSTVTRRRAMTWPSHSMESQEMIDIYKKYLREEKNVSVPDSAGQSIFDKYRFTADSNYYDEDINDLPQNTLHPY